MFAGCFQAKMRWNGHESQHATQASKSIHIDIIVAITGKEIKRGCTMLQLHSMSQCFDVQTKHKQLKISQPQVNINCAHNKKTGYFVSNLHEQALRLLYPLKQANPETSPMRIRFVYYER